MIQMQTEGPVLNGGSLRLDMTITDQENRGPGLLGGLVGPGYDCGRGEVTAHCVDGNSHELPYGFSSRRGRTSTSVGRRGPKPSQASTPRSGIQRGTLSRDYSDSLGSKTSWPL